MSIKIKNKYIDIPVVQGGMGIGVSMGTLAGAVAREGGMGTISFVNIGYTDKDFDADPMGANKRCFEKEIDVARAISKGRGIITVNIMHVVNHLKEYLSYINTTSIDGVVVGAGLPLELPEYIDDNKIIAPIISSARALKLIFKRWVGKYNRKPDFIVFEGPEAGGHLGFKREELDMDIWAELKSIIQVKKEYEMEEKIPLFIGGGFGTHEKFVKAMASGADGVQVGTGFLFTEESSLEKNVKEKLLDYIKSFPDRLEIIKSPVNLLARGVSTEFTERTKEERVPAKKCKRCICTCDPATTPYCINEALIRAVKGDFGSGLFFAGTDAAKINSIMSVKDYIKKLLGSEKNE